MDAAARAALLDQVLDASRALLALAEAGDWEAGFALDARRQDLIRRCFAVAAPFADRAASAATLAQILDLDARTLAMAEAARPELAAAAGRLRQGRAALAAYGRVGV